MTSSKFRYLSQFFLVLCILGCIPFLYFTHELRQLNQSIGHEFEAKIQSDNSTFTMLSADGQPLVPLLDQQSTPFNDPINELAKHHPNLWSKIQTHPQGNLFYQGRHYHFLQLILPTSDNELNKIFIFNSQDPQSIAQYDAVKRQQLLTQAIAVFILVLIISLGGMVWNINHHKNSLESKLALAAMNGMSAMMITDKQNRIVKVNSEFTRLIGYRSEEVIGKPLSYFGFNRHNQQFYVDMWRSLQNQGFWEGEVINKRKDGAKLTVILRIQAVLDQDKVIQYYIASFVDITQRKQLENRLRELSERDPLTGIYNRRKFDQHIQLECQRAQRYPDQEHSCLVIIDIDHFKQINDQYGHSYGDKILKSVAATLGEGIRESDFLARIGGEEFAIILPHTPIEEAQTVIDRLRMEIYYLHQNRISISAGISAINQSEQASYQRADKALYESKLTGRNQVTVNVEHLLTA